MRYRGRTVLVALVAALALGALASASASAQKMVPEFTPTVGKFPVGIENKLHNGYVEMNTQSVKFHCGESRTTGEITGSRSVALTLEWVHCQVTPTQPVRSEGAPAETVVITGTGNLFYIDKAEKRVGIVFTLKKVNLEIANGKGSLEGSIVIPVYPINTKIGAGSSRLSLPMHAGKNIGEPEVRQYENEMGETKYASLKEAYGSTQLAAAVEMIGGNEVAPNKELEVTGESSFDLGEFGSEGSGDGQFSYPEDVAFASNGDLYVTDRGNNRVQELTATGEFIRAWGFGVGKAGKNELEVCTTECKAGIAGSGNGQFSYPEGIAVNQSTGDVYVVDGENLRVEEFSATGEFIRKWGEEGTGGGKFGKKSIYGWEGADGIAVAPNGTVYVADTANHCVQQFKEEGKYVKEWGSAGHGGGGTFNGLGNVAVAPNGNVYTSEESSVDHVQEFSGIEEVAQWGPAEAGSEGIAVAANGSVYVSDRASGASVQTFSSSGELFGQWGSEGSGIEQFVRPTGVAVDPLNGDVYVVSGGMFGSGARLEYFQPSI